MIWIFKNDLKKKLEWKLEGAWDGIGLGGGRGREGS